MRLRFLARWTDRIKLAMDHRSSQHDHFDLLALPNELIAAVVEHVAGRQELVALASACRLLQSIAEPALYRHVFIRTGDQARRMADSFEARTQRPLALHSLELPCDGSYPQSFDSVARILSGARNLERFELESPQCNNTVFEDGPTWHAMTDPIFSVFADASCLRHGPASQPLQGLKKLTIHMNGIGSPYWTPDSRSSAIFLLPSLQELKISCVNLLDGLEQALGSVDGLQTPLRHLILEECNVTHHALLILLSLPRALETLYLGENCHNVRNFTHIVVDRTSNRLFAKNASATLVALKQQQHSLRRLHYITPSRLAQIHPTHDFTTTKPTHIGGGFADFAKLETVVLDGFCPTFQQSVMGFSPPPALREITYIHNGFLRTFVGRRDPETAAVSTIPFLGVPSCSVPRHLKKLTLVFTGLGPFEDKDSDFVRAMADHSRHRLGVNLRIHFADHGSFYPPLLFGEPQPEVEEAFDLDNGGWTSAGRMRTQFFRVTWL